MTPDKPNRDALITAFEKSVSGLQDLDCTCDTSDRPCEIHIAAREYNKAKAALVAYIDEIEQRLETLKPHRDDYRLNAADLDRIVNEAGSGNDLSDAVKDLLLAHYQCSGHTEKIEALEAENAQLRAKLLDIEREREDDAFRQRTSD